MANSHEEAVAALEVYETLVAEIGQEHARKALHVLDGMRAPALKRIDLMQKRTQFVELVTGRPSLPARIIAEHLHIGRRCPDGC
jgi:hypothetical protein